MWSNVTVEILLKTIVFAPMILLKAIVVLFHLVSGHVCVHQQQQETYLYKKPFDCQNYLHAKLAQYPV